MLEVIGVSKSYRGARGERIPVIENVDLTVSAGEVVLLTGASGSGKSTLLRIAALLTRPDCGVLRLNGHDLDAADEKAARAARQRDIGLVFQGSNLLPDLTVLDNLLVASADGDRDWAENLLRQFALAELAAEPAKQLSGGQQQRVAFCRALINRPRVILADEPSSGLDATARNRILDLVAALAQDERAVLIASHDVAFSAVAGRVVQIREGSLV